VLLGTLQRLLGVLTFGDVRGYADYLLDPSVVTPLDLAANHRPHDTSSRDVESVLDLVRFAG